MAVGGPQLQFRVAVGAKPRQIIVAARKEVDPAERLRMAAIQSFGEPDDRRQHPNGPAQRAAEIAIALV